ncbi:VanZ family protein [Leifsonia shinshuensis]|uniref:VanZ family protein n=1 Tax=Leifsonia shinshuensis TaxID=150026 RepID=A0A7G6YAK3_9MICO|nr:VanZ family protein [Leifsonia shinshuensis]QNE35518.1 VanZ family protein [Leifsonia shinshuensis]
MPDQSLTESPRSTRARLESVIVWVVFGLYLVFLLKLLLFSRVPGSERSVNLIPFASIADYLGGPASVRRFAFANVAGNILVFVPLGAYLAFLRRRVRIWSNVLIVAGASVAVEILQGVLAVGASDIDDVILNSLGGLLGVLAVVALRRKARPDRVRTVIAVASVVAVPVLLFLTVVVRLRI